MSDDNLTAPSVYIEELTETPWQVASAETAIPAFVGYTPKPLIPRESIPTAPVRICSLKEFQDFFGPADDVMQPAGGQLYSPQYYLSQQDGLVEGSDKLNLRGSKYALIPDPRSIYYLYNSLRLFYANGGAAAYIVSAGEIAEPSPASLATVESMQGDGHIVNSNISVDSLCKGFELLREVPEVTMYVCPDATLLSANDNATLMQKMLLQADQMRTAVCVFDIIGGRNPVPETYQEDIQLFRDNTGLQGLGYGVAYYPFVETSITLAAELDYRNLFAGDTKPLQAVLSADTNPDEAVLSILHEIDSSQISDTQTVRNFDQALMLASPAYASIMKQLAAQVNVLPSSAALAGVYTLLDETQGVWKAPANRSINGANGVAIDLDDQQQVGLNVDALGGKSINLIRSFAGRGILIWGARTLDGNSQDWRYVSVRRMMIYLEQSVKSALSSLSFEPNSAITWRKVKQMTEVFLADLWRQGGLQGQSPDQAFFVRVGLGETMTQYDIDSGQLIVEVGVAPLRPAEFVIFRIGQKVAG